MNKILVPCDFSEPAINAFRFALNVCSRSAGTIHLIRVIELPVLHDTLLMPTLSVEQDFMDELKEKSASGFKKLTAKHNAGNVKVTSEIAFGHIIPSILENTGVEFDTIIMGSHGTSGLSELFIGSTAEKVIRRSTVPVIIVKDRVDANIKNIVFPVTQETEKQEGLIAKVKELQRYFDATLHIVSINTPATFTSDTATRERLSSLVRNFGIKNCSVNIFNHENEEGGIFSFAKTIDADMVAMGTHGRRGLSHWASGSITEDVVNHAKIPIWTSVIT